jgi:hypothetical protein
MYPAPLLILLKQGSIRTLGFSLLPALITAILTFEIYGISGKERALTRYLFIFGEIISFVAGELYSLVFLSALLLILAGFGVALIAVGGIIGIRYLIKCKKGCPRSEDTGFLMAHFKI